MIGAEQLNERFLREYTSQDAILKYSTDTAGYGVQYVIEHEYGRIYDEAIEACRQTSDAPLRLLEFGCGAGMNLIGLLSRLVRQGIPVKDAFGTDFSPSLVECARREARARLHPVVADKVSFHVARNERLSLDLSLATDRPAASLLGSFDFVFGVNTFRYCHRLGNADACASDIYHLLRPGGTCVMIDMNNRFPLFRSRLKDANEPAQETYLPTLEEYAVPFERSGFEITTKDHCCWVPHSAGRTLTAICRALTPLLGATVRSRAMRSVVVGRRPS